MNTLAGKVVLVTGAGRGIGKAVSVLLAQAGCRVVLVSRSRDQLDAGPHRLEDPAEGLRASGFAQHGCVPQDVATAGAAGAYT